VSRQVGEIDQILPPSLLQHPAGVREQRNGAVRRERQLTLADLDPPPLARDLVDLLGQLVSDLRGDTLRHTGISLQTEGRERAIPALRRRAGTARGGSVHGDSARALDVLMRARPPLIGTVASGGSSRSAMESTGSSAKPPGSGSSPVPSADRMDAWTASLSGAHAVGIGTCPPSSRQSRPQGDPGTTVGRPRSAAVSANRSVRSPPPAAMRRTRPFASPLVELRGQRRSAPRSLPAQRLELSAPARRAGPSVSRARTGRWCRSRGSGGWARTPPCPGRRRAAIRRPLAAPGATSSAGCPPHPWPAAAGRGSPCACIRGTRR